MIIDEDILRSNSLKELMFNGRHYNVTLVLSVQYPMLTPALRQSIDNVLTTHDNNMSNIKRLYEHYYGNIPTLSCFKEINHTLNPFIFLFESTTTSMSQEVIGWL